MELLAPAGNLEKLKIAIAYGADAVYLAGQQFGLRTAAGNFTESELGKAVKHAHHLGRKVYIALNAFLHQAEIDLLPEFVKFLDSIKVDAVICSDMGVVEAVNKYTHIPVHISTQASVLNRWHAEIWKDMGAQRIVVGRELSIKEAAEIRSDVDIEIEMFIHGAMCMAYSGQCFLSNYTVNRDANRGGCIQNCRFNYEFLNKSGELEEATLLSSKDLCGLSLLPQFFDAGIDSVKIEGRMRSSLYVATTVRAHSQAIRSIRQDRSSDNSYWEEELMKLPNRGYTKGFLEEPAGYDSVMNHQESSDHQYKMAGIVLEVDSDNNRAAFQVKNKLMPGDTIEILLHSSKTISIILEEITNMTDHPLEAAQPNSVIWIPHKTGIDAMCVGRVLK